MGWKQIITIDDFSGFANPSAVAGGAAVNGSAITAMRSDGAPALGPLTRDLDHGGYKATNAADPTSAQHLATKAYVDSLGRRESFVAVGLSANLAVSQFILSDGTNGPAAALDGTIFTLTIQAQVALAAGTDITVTVFNIATPTETDTITISAGEKFKTKSVAIDMVAGDMLAMRVTGLTGTPAAGVILVTAVKAP